MKDLTNEEINEILCTVGDGVLSLSIDDKPYGIPFGFVYINGNIYLSMLPMGRKWEIINKNKNVCFTVFKWNDDHTEWASVVIDGEITIVDNLDEIELVVKENIRKVGLKDEGYLEKRMEMYRKNINNPKSLKILRIDTSNIGGKKMKTLIGS
ncbi:MAG: hypothetical protein D6734_07050 [Candidatus Schekmanbacteria bacterium]|nr:MAG: hypothetical protein D6734_07050 [Candidatus Schekmanbacteria bacterium]